MRQIVLSSLFSLFAILFSLPSEAQKPVRPVAFSAAGFDVHKQYTEAQQAKYFGPEYKKTSQRDDCDGYNRYEYGNPWKDERYACFYFTQEGYLTGFDCFNMQIPLVVCGKKVRIGDDVSVLRTIPGMTLIPGRPTPQGGQGYGLEHKLLDDARVGISSMKGRITGFAFAWLP